LRITFDPAKRDLTLKNRGLDFGRAADVFSGRTITLLDDRFDYGESRFITAGYLGARMVVIVWTARGHNRHVISMRHCHAKEEKLWLDQMG
jgi:uncharacterized DUF497 family protein